MLDPNLCFEEVRSPTVFIFVYLLYPLFSILYMILVILGGFEDEDLPLTYYVDYRVGKPKRKRRDTAATEPKWINMHSSLNPITDLSMFPAGDKDDNDRIYLRIYVEDAYRGRSEAVEKIIRVSGQYTTLIK